MDWNNQKPITGCDKKVQLLYPTRVNVRNVLEDGTGLLLLVI